VEGESVLPAYVAVEGVFVYWAVGGGIEEVGCWTKCFEDWDSCLG
jgi:hypothetical protein